MKLSPRSAFLLFGLTYAACAQQPTTPAVQDVDQIVAIVNDDVITLNELNARLKTVERQLRKQNAQLPPEVVIRRQLLDRMVADRLQLQMARDMGLHIGNAEVDSAISRIAANNKLDVSAFRQALEKDGVDWQRFRDEIRDEITISRVREREVDSRITVSDGEIDNYLASQHNDNQTVSLAHIILRVPENASSSEIDKIRNRANEVLQQAKNGADFANLAIAWSQAPDALSGGALGERTMDRLPPLYADAVRDLQPGEVSAVLRSPAGFHIVKLLARSGGAALKPVAQTHVRHILIKVNDLVNDDEARRRLADLRERLSHGESFAQLARQYSNDLSAANGGDLGWLYPGDTVPEFERAMNALKPGEISQPVKTPFGWHLIQVLERRYDSASPERRRLAARQALRERKLDEAYEEWLRQLRDKAYVDIRLE